MADFTSLNGYDVKDKIAREQINGILNDKVNFRFPKFTSNEWSADGNLIKYEGKNILIDTNGAINWTSFKNYLDDNNVSHIDYLIM